MLHASQRLQKIRSVDWKQSELQRKSAQNTSLIQMLSLSYLVDVYVWHLFRRLCIGYNKCLSWTSNFKKLATSITLLFSILLDQDVLCETTHKNGKVPLNKRQSAHQEYVDRRKNTHAVIFDECMCDFECSNKISMSRRYEINEAYWKLSLDKKRSFIVKHSFRADVKRRRVESNISGSSFKRSCTYAYKLNDNNHADHPVCARFFLNTLGYKSSSK